MFTQLPIGNLATEIPDGAADGPSSFYLVIYVLRYKI